jgi:hypothetical protein
MGSFVLNNIQNYIVTSMNIAGQRFVEHAPTAMYKLTHVATKVDSYRPIQYMEHYRDNRQVGGVSNLIQ